MECDRRRKWNHRKERPANEGNNQQKRGKTKEKQQKKGKENEKDGAVERHRSQKK